ncbi:pyruvate formate-lyase-activating protein [Actinoplanes sp. NPDC051861]|uniref:pyruvate formate-lyase-activating protein n=1 Tax=Actinoplanes sp. NPDC051861 TaxID=3155170 RepID=UPI00343D269F
MTVTGSVHSFDVSTGVDGPGTRFVAFLAGCPLRCQYCHSPDTWYRRTGREMTADDLLTEISRYERFIKVAGGGVTLSGGEALQQPDFVREIFTRCHDKGLHTALDTSGFLGAKASDDLLAVTDLVLLDIKAGDEETYRKVTRTGELAPTVEFAHRLAALGVPVWVRFVLVPGLTDSAENVEAVARIAASIRTVERVEVLPFHRLGAAKYTALSIPFPLADTPAPSPELIDRVRTQFRAHGLTVY